MNVGRNNNADPRWLLPIICRMGQVTKPDVGSIRILDRETRFEIAPTAAARFAAALHESRDPKIRIEPAGAEGAPPPRERKPYRPKEGYDPAKQSYPPRENDAAAPAKKKFKKAKAG
jgi:ATP-dependent RNA helicase DeaD